MPAGTAVGSAGAVAGERPPGVRLDVLDGVNEAGGAGAVEQEVCLVGAGHLGFSSTLHPMNTLYHNTLYNAILFATKYGIVRHWVVLPFASWSDG